LAVGQQQFYASTPYTDSLPAVIGLQRTGSYTNNITPPRNNSPYNGTQPTPTPGHQGQHSQMAAPAMSNAQPQAGAVQSPVNKTAAPPIPQSPKTQALDRERVTLLLEINQILLQEIVTMQEQGKGGDVQSPAHSKPEEKKESSKPASKEYVE